MKDIFFAQCEAFATWEDFGSLIQHQSVSEALGPRFLIVGRKRVSAYDLWQCPCYRLWQ